MRTMHATRPLPLPANLSARCGERPPGTARRLPPSGSSGSLCEAPQPPEQVAAGSGCQRSSRRGPEPPRRRPQGAARPLSRQWARYPWPAGPRAARGRGAGPPARAAERPGSKRGGPGAAAGSSAPWPPAPAACLQRPPGHAPPVRPASPGDAEAPAWPGRLRPLRPLRSPRGAGRGLLRSAPHPEGSVRGGLGTRPLPAVARPSTACPPCLSPRLQARCQPHLRAAPVPAVALPSLVVPMCPSLRPAGATPRRQQREAQARSTRREQPGRTPSTWKGTTADALQVPAPAPASTNWAPAPGPARAPARQWSGVATPHLAPGRQ
mmetsp:Transcript_2967/g.9308  ORF Transcript_2967/g.9308 Transcript_2967/m.9308 type:complete len:323 (+) Transcript_2967:992-1960(+)